MDRDKKLVETHKAWVAWKARNGVQRASAEQRRACFERRKLKAPRNDTFEISVQRVKQRLQMRRVKSKQAKKEMKIRRGDVALTDVSLSGHTVAISWGDWFSWP